MWATFGTGNSGGKPNRPFLYSLPLAKPKKSKLLYAKAATYRVYDITPTSPLRQQKSETRVKSYLWTEKMPPKSGI